MRPKFYHAWAKPTDSNGETHYITVVGKVEQKRKYETVMEDTPIIGPNLKEIQGILAYDIRRFNRKLTLAASICHPNDAFNENEGVRIAKRRIEKGYTLGTLETPNINMLNEDAVMAEIIVKLNHIVGHIGEFIGE